VSKLGCHVVQGPRNGFGDFLSRIRGANQLLTLVKCVDDFGAAYEAKQHNSITITIGRLNGIYDENGNWRDLQAFEPRDWPSAQAAADAYFSLVRARWSLNPWIDVWETFNEFSAHWAWQADFYIRMMELAEANGHTLALYACSTGNPPRPADDGGAAYAAILSACRRAQQGGHFLALHEYGLAGTLRGTQPDLALRYRGLATYLLERDAMIPIIISEAGQNAGYQFIGTQQFIDDFAWYDSELMRDAYVVGAAAWTLGKWEEANFQDALPALTDYIITHPTPVEPPPPPPPPDPEPCRGLPRTDYERVYYVIPPDATESRAAEIFRIGWTESKRTVGGSYDDAGIGDLPVKVAVLWDIPVEQRQIYLDWYATHYPGVRVEFR